jgi:hypothetical protein
MTDAERKLLLTVARILRANIKHISLGWMREDSRALNEALAPFELSDALPTNEASE